MLRSRFLALVTGLVLSFGIGASPAAAAADAEGFIRSLADKALAIVTDKGQTKAEERTKFRALLREGFDVDGIGRFLIGRHWKTASDEDRAAYIKAFESTIVYTYANRFDDYSGQKLEVTGHRQDGDFVMVTSRIFGPSSPDIRVDWRVIPAGATFKVIDVVIEGVSMSVTQRDEYVSVIQSNGGKLNALTDELTRKMARLGGS